MHYVLVAVLVSPLLYYWPLTTLLALIGATAFYWVCVLAARFDYWLEHRKEPRRPDTKVAERNRLRSPS
jgi:hypothetical protein